MKNPLTLITIVGLPLCMAAFSPVHPSNQESSAEKENKVERAHYIGEMFGGGVVFWVDHTGEHGLILSMADLSTGHPWSNVGDALYESSNDWDGKNNSKGILGQEGHESSAALLCDEYVNEDYGTGKYSDWYLPSISELNQVWNHYFEVQRALTLSGNAGCEPLVQNYYWSSTEYKENRALYFVFFDGTVGYERKSRGNHVRAVRAF
jgi:hypothetical protein